MAGFLDRISGLLDKGLLLAAIFPLLIAGFIVAAASATVVGWRASFFWFGGLSAANAAILTAVLTLALLLLAFILRSLRRPILSLWSGAGGPSWMRDRQQRRRGRLQERVDAPLIWANFGEAVDTIDHDERPNAVPPEIKADLLRRIDRLATRRHSARQDRLRRRFNRLCACIENIYRQYDGESLVPVRQNIAAFGEERKNHEEFERNDLRNRLAVEYGQEGLIEGTRLGNILAALDDYPFTRYGMEGSVFWPHLEQQIKGDLLDDIRNQRILLDFELALASLLLVLALLALLAEPWVSFGTASWIVVPLVVVALAILSRGVYLAALPTANAMSGSLRAGCDLYRQDLLWALGVYAPRTLDAERDTWGRLSRLVLYGNVRAGLLFRPRPPQAPPGRDP